MKDEIEDVVNELDRRPNIKPGKYLKQGREFLCNCPFHDDREPSFSINTESGAWQCFGCKEKGNLAELRFKLMLDGRPPNIRREGAEPKRPEVKPPAPVKLPYDFLAQISTPVLDEETKKYLLSRHIDPDRVKGHVWSLAQTGNPAYYRLGHRLIISEIRDGQVVSLKYRSIRPDTSRKVLNHPGLSPSLIGLDDVEGLGTAIIVEGEIDYLVGLSAGINGLLSLPGVTYKITDEEKDSLPGQVILLLDNDAEGAANAPRLARELSAQGRHVIIASYPTGIKDLAELAVSVKGDSDALIRQVDKALASGAVFMPFQTSANIASGILGKMDRTLKEVESGGTSTPAVFSIGVHEFDALMNGGFRRGLYGISGRPGSCKTSLTLSMCRNIAATGRTVIFFSLEMTAEDLVSIQLSWGTGISKIKLLDMTVDRQEYERICSHVAAHHGLYDNLIVIDTVRSIAEMRRMTTDIMNAVGEPVFVAVDYLQMIRSESTSPRSQDIRINVKEAACALKDLANELEIPVFVISSVARENYKKPGAGSDPLSQWKESGDIEYSLYCGFNLDELPPQKAGSYNLQTVRVNGESVPVEKLVVLQLVKNRWGSVRDSVGNYMKLTIRLNLLDGSIKIASMGF